MEHRVQCTDQFEAPRSVVQVPRWVRGKESATLLVGGPGGRTVPLYILGLGTSVGTPPEGHHGPGAGWYAALMNWRLWGTRFVTVGD